MSKGLDGVLVGKYITPSLGPERGAPKTHDISQISAKPRFRRYKRP